MPLDYANMPFYGGGNEMAAYTQALLPPPMPISQYAGMAGGAPYSMFAPPSYSPLPMPGPVGALGPNGNGILQMAGMILPAMMGMGGGDAVFGGFGRFNPMEAMMGRDWYQGQAMAGGWTPTSAGSYMPARESDIAGITKVMSRVGEEIHGGRQGMLISDLQQLKETGAEELKNFKDKQAQLQKQFDDDNAALAKRAEETKMSMLDRQKESDAIRDRLTAQNEEVFNKTQAFVDEKAKAVPGFKSAKQEVAEASRAFAEGVGNSPWYGAGMGLLGSTPIIGDLLSAMGVGVGAQMSLGVATSVRGMAQYGMFAPAPEVLAGATAEMARAFGWGGEGGGPDLRLTRGMNASELAGLGSDLVRFGMYRGAPVTQEEVKAQSAADRAAAVAAGADVSGPITSTEERLAEGKLIGKRISEQVKGWTESVDVMKDIFGDKIPNLLEKLNQMTAGTLHQTNRQQVEKLLYDIKETAAIAGTSAEVVANVVQFAAQSARARGLSVSLGQSAATLGMRQAAATQAATQGATGSDYVGTLSQEEEATAVMDRGMAGGASAYGIAAGGILSMITQAAGAADLSIGEGPNKRNATRMTPEEQIAGLRARGLLSGQGAVMANRFVQAFRGQGGQATADWAYQMLRPENMGRTAELFAAEGSFGSQEVISQTMMTTNPKAQEELGRLGAAGILAAQNSDIRYTIGNTYAGNLQTAAAKFGVNITEEQARAMQGQLWDVSRQGTGTQDEAMRNMTKKIMRDFNVSEKTAVSLANTVNQEFEVMFQNPALGLQGRSVSDVRKQTSEAAGIQARVMDAAAAELTTIDKQMKELMPEASAGFASRLMKSFMDSGDTSLGDVVKGLVGGFGSTPEQREFLKTIEKPMDAFKAAQKELLSVSATDPDAVKKRVAARDKMRVAGADIEKAFASGKDEVAKLGDKAAAEDARKAKEAEDSKGALSKKDSSTLEKIAENTGIMAKDKVAAAKSAAEKTLSPAQASLRGLAKDWRGLAGKEGDYETLSGRDRPGPRIVGALAAGEKPIPTGASAEEKTKAESLNKTFKGVFEIAQPGTGQVWGRGSGELSMDT